jgi:hypothetical protein
MAMWEPVTSHRGEWPMNAPSAGRAEVKQEPEETKGQVIPEGITDDDDIFLVRTWA